MKYRLWDMSHKEAEEAFKRSDTVIFPTGTLHGHGPTPISVDSSSVEWIADKVGEKTGMVVLPCADYGENEKQKYYPGSIAISEETLESFYLDIYRSLRRNGVRKVIVFNGHGGNRESLIRAGRKARDFGMITPIMEWWSVGRIKMGEDFTDLYTDGKSFIAELAVAMAIQGNEIADLRGAPGYRGEWGAPYTVREIFGDKIKTLQFNDYLYDEIPIIIPTQAWDIDLEGPPILEAKDAEHLGKRGQELLDRLVGYFVSFAKDFEKTDVSKYFRSKDDF